jgi:hypothetical protein
MRPPRKAARRADSIDRRSLSRQSVGTVAHVVIQEAVGRPNVPEPQAIVDAALSLIPLSVATVHRLAAAQRAATLAANYLQRFDPRPGWRLGGIEAVFEDVSVDIVWLSDGVVTFDEIKTGPSAHALSNRAVAAQVTAQLDVGRKAFGVHFAGVRLVALSAPATVRWYPASDRFDAHA